MQYIWDQGVSFMVAIASGGRGGEGRGEEEMNFPEEGQNMFKCINMYKLKHLSECFLLVQVATVASFSAQFLQDGFWSQIGFFKAEMAFLPKFWVVLFGAKS